MKKLAVHLLDVVSILLLCAAMCISFFSIVAPSIGNAAWDGTVAASFASGSGTEANPYLIKTESQMGYFMKQMSQGVTYKDQYIRLENSLDMTGNSWSIPWNVEFQGSFNGNGYTITADCPLFAGIGAEGSLVGLNYTVVKQVERALLCTYNDGLIDSCVCYGNVYLDAGASVEAGMICTANSGTVTNCGAIGSVKAYGDDTSALAAMICKNFRNISNKTVYGTISNCYSALEVYANGVGKYSSEKYDPLTLGATTGCYYNKDLFTGTAQSGVGMTTEEMKSEAFLASLRGTSVSGTNWVTGSHGYPELAHDSANYAYVDGYKGEKTIVSATGSFILRSSTNSGYVYYTLDGSDPTVSSSNPKRVSSGGTITVSGDAVLTIAPYNNGSYGTVSRVDIIALAGAGTEANPYQISTKKQLSLLNRYPDKHFKVMNNITFTEDDYAFGGVLAGGWVPVEEFSGVLDGQGYAITGLQGKNGGLIETNSGTVTSLRLVDHKLFAYGNYGVIAEHNSGTITRCYLSSAFTVDSLPAKATAGANEVGGVAGSNTGEISYCHNDGVTVYTGAYENALQIYVGGICGYNNGTLTNCVNTGTVILMNYQHPDNGYVGGIVGRGSAGNCLSDTDFIIEQSFDYNVRVGGVSGQDPYFGRGAYLCVASEPDVILRVTGYIAPITYEYTFAADYSNCYYLEEAGLPSECPNLDFTNAWMLSENGLVPQGVMDADGHCFMPNGTVKEPSCRANGSVPVKCAICGKTETQTIPAGDNHAYVNGFCSVCDGYEPAVLKNGVYEISNAGQLYWFAELVNGGTTNVNAVLTKDIDLNPGYVFNADGTVTKDGTLATGNKRSWTPIGKESGNSKNYYAGTFNGMGYAVSGIYTTYSSQVSATGLFGYVAEGGKVQNVGVENAYIAGYMWTAGVAGVNYGTVTNCYSMATVDSNHKAGGVVGNNIGTVEDCYNTGNVDGGDSVGGVVGESYGTITNCHNTGAVNGSNFDVGGVVGYNKGPVENCYNTGSVVGESSCVGGVVGIHQSGTVRNCYNSGDVTGNSGASGHGGVIGSNSATVEKCYNTGNVTGGSNVGGVVGGNGRSSVMINCYNTGVVYGSSYTGGVTGNNYGKIENCYSIGNMRGGSYRGSVAGYNEGTITNCYYLEGGYGGIRDTNVSGSAEVRSEEAFASGEVANLLQGEQTTQTWGQKIGEDDYPVLSADKVYKNQTGGCDAESFTYAYSNTQKTAVTTHDWQNATCENPKTCADCGATEGKALGHSTEAEGDRAATCKDPAYCSRCEKEYGESNGDHSYENGFCAVCDDYEPAVLKNGVYEISNAGQLYWFAALVNGDTTAVPGIVANKSANAVLTKDIIVNENVLRANGTLNRGEFRKWTPIGIASSRYTGTFNGANYTISGLYFNDNTANCVGLFGYTNGVVKNAGVIQSYICGKRDVGGVAGWNNTGGIVSNCYVTGNVSGEAEVGSLVGKNNATIQNCYNTGIVSGSTSMIGGVAGYNAMGIVKLCYNTGNVGGNNSIGGIVGYSDGTVTNSYNTGAISGQSSIGGVAGSNGSTVTNCYNVGRVIHSGNAWEYAGGVVGFGDGKVTNCYFDSTVYSGKAVGYGNGILTNVEGKTTAQFDCGEVAYLLQGNQETQTWGQKIGEDAYPVFSADVVYKNQTGGCTEETYTYIYNNVSAEPVTTHNWQDATCENPKTCLACGATEGKPLADGHNWLAATCLAPETCEYCDLTRGEPIPHSYTNGFCVYCDRYEPCGGKGSLMDPYTISNAGQLYWFAAVVNTGYDGLEANRVARGILTADIIVNQNVLVDGELNSNHAGFRSWKPVGYSGINNSAVYNGTFDGQNHTIRGLYLVDYGNQITPTFCGLFGWCGTDSVLRNITVADSYFGASGSVGGIVGFSQGVVSGCINYARVDSTGGANGGIAGSMTEYTSTVSDCINYGTISGTASCGGIVGQCNSITITNCINEGNVSGESSVGGILGHGTTVIDCTNRGTVTGTADRVGGILGNGNELQNCRNEGDVIGIDYVGGIAGSAFNVTDCTNIGDVTGTGDYVGGGMGEGGTILRLWNEGTVRGNHSVGGIVGQLNGSMSNGHNSGDVIATGNRVGGVVGMNNNGSPGIVSNTGSVTGHSNVGGVVGAMMGGSMRTAYNTGTVTGSMEGECAGGIAGYNAAEIVSCHNVGAVQIGMGMGGIVGVNEGTVTGSYYLEGTASGGIMGQDVPGSAEVKSAEDFASGEVIYLLYQSTGVYGTWGQLLGTDSWPVFSQNLVYRNQTGGCTEDSYIYEYSNTLTAPVTTHDWETSGNVCETGGTCRRCGATNPGMGHSTMAPGDRAATCVSRAYCSVC